MIDVTGLNVKELRDILVTKCGLTEEAADAIKGKAELINKIREYTEETTLVSAFDEAAEVLDDDSEIEFHSPSDRDWTEYVLSKLYDDEMFDGKPKVDGLRRISEELIGPLLSIESEPLQVPTPDNQWHSTVRCRIVCQKHNTDMIVTVDGCADVGHNNTQSVFSRHSVATAESRAESRAYRKLLRLRNIITAEESVNIDELGDDKINGTQINMIDSICKKLNININKWLSTHGILDINKISHSKGIQLCEELNGFRSTGAISPEILETVNNES